LFQQILCQSETEIIIYNPIDAEVFLVKSQAF